MRPVLQRGLLRLGLAAVLVVGLGACDTTVRPIESRGRHFSIFGLLNPARDTQFVRVEPLTDSIQVGSSPDIDATVALTRVGTGRTVTLKDSTVRLPITGPLGEDVALVHNFWTTVPIEPGARYRLTARHPDGTKSWATTTLPDRAPDIETIRNPVLPCGLIVVSGTVRIETDYLIEATVVYPLPSGPKRVDYTSDATRHNGTYRLQFDYEQDGGCDVRGDAFELVAYAGGPAWPRLSNIGNVSPEALLALDTLSNVQQGVGFFGGAFSARAEIPIQRLTP